MPNPNQNPGQNQNDPRKSQPAQNDPKKGQQSRTDEDQNDQSRNKKPSGSY